MMREHLMTLEKALIADLLGNGALRMLKIMIFI